jgi:hypothetical protein
MMTIGEHTPFVRSIPTSIDRQALYYINNGLFTYQYQVASTPFNATARFDQRSLSVMAGISTGLSGTLSAYVNNIFGTSIAGPTATIGANATTSIGVLRTNNGFFYYTNGDISEIVAYPTNRIANNSQISSSIGAYYQAFWQGTQQALLDQFGGSAAAFSLRNLSSSYRGPLVRVRRSTI